MVARDQPYSKKIKLENAIEYSQHALELANEFAKKSFPVETDFVQAYWLLGSSYRQDGQLDFAEQHLNEALARGRAINLVDREANILLDLARLHYDQKNYEEAESLAEEALTITERCGYVLQGADVNLFLAELAVKGYKLESEKDLSDKEAALLHAKRAKELATCDGPPYYYKVAYEEAERFIARLRE